ncbi:MAG: DUF368 domain-containing protein [Lachnospiraceae bacterium]|nr:DUF368 domain-containing protein [Lachnospiraceae bacterium]MDE7434287.1 DUF368 domain-containing protein [Lachnospiraceae bacterium]
MSLADSVPGVSGGTIAFILGIYDKFIFSLNHVISGTKEERKEALVFLVKLMGGWVIGLCSSILVLGSIFDSHIYQLCSLFLGLSLFAIPIIIREEQEVLKGKYYNLVFTVLGAAIVCLLTYFNPSKGDAVSMDLSSLSFGTAIYVFAVAMIAIAAMVLPGISGSTLLLIFGVYVPIITAIKEFLHMNFVYVPVLFVFGFGMIAGVLTTIKLVKKGLERYRSQMVYLILGLMLGSFYAIVMGPTTLDEPQAAMSWGTFQPLFFLLGALILAGLQLLKRVVENHAS